MSISAAVVVSGVLLECSSYKPRRKEQDYAVCSPEHLMVLFTLITITIFAFDDCWIPETGLFQRDSWANEVVQGIYAITFQLVGVLLRVLYENIHLHVPRVRRRCLQRTGTCDLKVQALVDRHLYNLR